MHCLCILYIVTVRIVYNFPHISYNLPFLIFTEKQEEGGDILFVQSLSEDQRVELDIS